MRQIGEFKLLVGGREAPLAVHRKALLSSKFYCTQLLVDHIAKSLRRKKVCRPTVDKPEDTQATGRNCSFPLL